MTGIVLGIFIAIGVGIISVTIGGAYFYYVVSKRH